MYVFIYMREREREREVGWEGSGLNTGKRAEPLSMCSHVYFNICRWDTVYDWLQVVCLFNSHLEFMGLTPYIYIYIFFLPWFAVCPVPFHQCHHNDHFVLC